MTRPRSVTLACWYAGIGALITLFFLVSVLWEWGSVSMQEAIADVMESSPLADSDVSLLTVMEALRWFLMGLVAAAVATIVFAIHTAKGHRPSRWCLSILLVGAMLLFVAAGLSGLFPAVLAFACVVMLWNAEARAWFAGKPLPLSKEPLAAGANQSQAARPAQQFPTYPAQGQPVDGSNTPQQGWGPPPPAVQTVMQQPGVRPSPVKASVLSAGLMGVVATGMSLMVLGSVVLFKDEFTRVLKEDGLLADQLDRMGITVDQFLSQTVFLSGAWLVVGIALIIAAGLLWNRGPAARTIAFLSALLLLVMGILVVPVGVIPIGVAVIMLISLRKAEVKTWLQAK